jgi:hypothetical protein
MDTLGCGFEALEYPACTKLMGPIVKGTIVPNGAKVPGTQFQLDPVQAAFNIGAMIRWLDFNDTWLAAEWGHPSDNLGGILATADWLSRNGRKITVRDVLTAMIKAHEIQGCIALENSFNKVGLDHVVLVKVASTAVVAQMLGLNREEVINAVSLAWVDGQSLRTYRHAPTTGSRKSWAAGDATSRAVRLALIARTGEMGYPSVLSAKGWGFYDVLFKGHAFKFQRPYGSYVMENVLFKVGYPAEFHAQTAVEAALQIHAQLRERSCSAAEIVRVARETESLIAGYSIPERDLLMKACPEQAEWIKANYLNANAAKWFKNHRPKLYAQACRSAGERRKPGLKDFLIQPAVGYPYKKYLLAVQPGSILGRLRTLLAKRGGIHRDLTDEARRDWTNLIEYNRQDVLGMQHLVKYVVAAGADSRGR